MITVDMALLSAITGTFVPLLTGLVLHWSASSRIKAVLNAALSFVAALTVVITQHNGVVTKQLVLSFLTTYLVSGSLHSHFWSPTGISAFIGTHTGGLFKSPEMKALLQAEADSAERAMKIAQAAAAARLAVASRTPLQLKSDQQGVIATVAAQLPYFVNNEVSINVADPDQAAAAAKVVDTEVADVVQTGFDKARDLLG